MSALHQVTSVTITSAARKKRHLLVLQYPTSRCQLRDGLGTGGIRVRSSHGSQQCLVAALASGDAMRVVAYMLLRGGSKLCLGAFEGNPQRVGRPGRRLWSAAMHVRT